MRRSVRDVLPPIPEVAPVEVVPFAVAPFGVAPFGVAAAEVMPAEVMPFRVVRFGVMLLGAVLLTVGLFVGEAMSAGSETAGSETSDAGERSHSTQGEAKSSRPSASSRCNVRVYVSDRDPAGLNVRHRAGARSEIVGKLPTTGVDAVILSVDEAKEGWLHFFALEVVAGDAQSSRAMTARAPESGWVFGGLTRVDLQPRIIGPSPKDVQMPHLVASERATPIVLEPGDRVASVLGCEGESVRVTIHRRRKGTRQTLDGWLSPGSYCGNPLTTCS